MGERQGLRVFLVQLKRESDCSRDLRNFYRVCKAVSEVIRETSSKDLSLPFQSPKCTGVYDAVAVALKIGSVRVRRLGKFSTAQSLWTKS